MKLRCAVLALATALAAWDAAFAAVCSPGESATDVVRFAVIGDSGSGKEPQYRIAHQMLQRHNRQAFDSVLMLGDNIYENGERKFYVKKFEEPYRELLSREVRFFASLGNHDVRRNNWRHAIDYPEFNMGGRRYYTFRLGGDLVQFFALDSTTLAKRSRRGRSPDPDQEAWLERELAASQAHWRIAFFHHPIYSSGRRHGGNKRVREAVEQILVEGGIDVVFAGHEHFYARLQPQQGVLHIVNGAAAKLRRGNISKKSSLTACGNDQERSFLYVELDREALHFEAISETGSVFDRGTLAYDPETGVQLEAHCAKE